MRTFARAAVRDADLLGGAVAVRRRYERRYLPGQALYREAASPLDRADIVIDNSDRPSFAGAAVSDAGWWLERPATDSRPPSGTGIMLRPTGSA